MASADVVVVGAGPAGLMAALVAARRGHSVGVLEAAPVVGGLAASFEVGGCRVDHGSHRLHPSIAPAILGDLRSLGCELEVRPRHGRIRLADRWVAFPLRAADLARSLPPRFALGAAVDSLRGVAGRAGGGSFSDVVQARLGRTMDRDFYGPYAQKLWGLDGSALSGEVARRRIAVRSPADVVRRALRPAHDPPTFLYPRRGFGEIAERLAAAVVAAGGTIHTGSAVTGLRPGSPVRVELESGAVLEAGQVWSTLPLPTMPALVAAAGGAVPAGVGDAAGRLGYRAMVLVYLVLDRRPYTEFDAHYFPDPAVVPTRLSEPSNYRDSPDDPPGRTVLCAEIPCAVGDDRWTAGAGALADDVVRSLHACGLPPVDPVAVEVRRLPRVYPLGVLGFERPLAVVDDWLTALPGVLTLGRPGLFVADNTHHVLAMGRAAGECLRPDGTFDRTRWGRARARFAGHVVED